MAKNANTRAVDVADSNEPAAHDLKNGLMIGAVYVGLDNDGEVTLPTGHGLANPVVYILTYGARKTMQDAVAGVLKTMTALFQGAAAGTLNEKDSKEYAKARDMLAKAADLPPTFDTSSAEGFAEAVAWTIREERRRKILSGEMIIGESGVRLSGLPKLMRDVAIARLRRVLAGAGKDWNKVDQSALIEQYLAKFSDAVAPGETRTVREEAEAMRAPTDSATAAETAALLGL